MALSLHSQAMDASLAPVDHCQVPCLDVEQCAEKGPTNGRQGLVDRHAPTSRASFGATADQIHPLGGALAFKCTSA